MQDGLEKEEIGGRGIMVIQLRGDEVLNQDGVVNKKEIMTYISKNEIIGFANRLSELRIRKI